MDLFVYSLHSDKALYTALPAEARPPAAAVATTCRIAAVLGGTPRTSPSPTLTTAPPATIVDEAAAAVPLPPPAPRVEEDLRVLRPVQGMVKGLGSRSIKSIRTAAEDAPLLELPWIPPATEAAAAEEEVEPTLLPPANNFLQ